MRGKKWNLVGKIQFGGNPFSSLGDDWCPRCKMIIDTDTDAEYGDNTYVYRRRCRRCGKVIKYGMMPNIPLINVDPNSLVCAAEWVTTPGQDRR